MPTTKKENKCPLLAKKCDLFKQITSEMADMYTKKNSNYGDSFGKLYEDLGPIAGLTPLHNKLDRLTSLVKGDENHFESIEDTLLDLANYSIMNLIEMRLEKEKENETNEETSSIDNSKETKSCEPNNDSDKTSSGDIVNKEDQSANQQLVEGEYLRDNYEEQGYDPYSWLSYQCQHCIHRDKRIQYNWIYNTTTTIPSTGVAWPCYQCKYGPWFMNPTVTWSGGSANNIGGTN